MLSTCCSCARTYIAGAAVWTTGGVAVVADVVFVPVVF